MDEFPVNMDQNSGENEHENGALAEIMAQLAFIERAKKQFSEEGKFDVDLLDQVRQIRIIYPIYDENNLKIASEPPARRLFCKTLVRDCARVGGTGLFLGCFDKLTFN